MIARPSATGAQLVAYVVPALAQALANNREFEKTLVNGVVTNGNSIRAGWQE